MSIHFQLIAFWLVCSPLFVLGFYAYYYALRLSKRISGIIRGGYITLVYLVFSAVFVSPILISLGEFEGWRSWFNYSGVNMLLYLLLYLLSITPGMIFFKIRYLEELKKVGLFKERGF